MVERNPSKKGLEEQMLLGRQDDHHSKESKKTNFFEEAWRRELEHQEQIKMKQKLPFVGSTSMPTYAQGSPSKLNPAGVKRKAISPSFQQKECQNQRKAQLQPQDLKRHIQGTQSYQPTPRRILHKGPLLLSKPSLQAPKGSPSKPNLASVKRKAISPTFQQKECQNHHQPQDLKPQTQWAKSYHPAPLRLLHKEPLSISKPSLQPPKEGFKTPWHLQKKMAGLPPTHESQMTSLWCDLCKVPCMNDFNLKQHCQGKKHKANCDKAFRSKNGSGGSDEKSAAFCRECNIECPNEMSLAQHRLGKKHVLRLIDLGVLKVPME